MSQIEITVRGAHTAHAQPERATVQLVVEREGGDANTVFADVSEIAGRIRGSIEPQHHPAAGPVTWWSSDQIRTWANRPWNNEGKQLPRVFHARISFEVKFSDFPEMSRWVTAAADVPGCSVNGIEWALTAAHRDELTASVRAAAVLDAVAKAQTYSDAIGSGTIRVTAIADAGMLGNGLDPTQPIQASFARMAKAGGGADIEFAPHDVDVTCQVDVRCITV